MPKSGNRTVIGGGKGKREYPKEKAEEEEDRLSELPDCLLHLILSFLPTKEVVKTCLLSKRWQFLWTYMSEVDLVDDTWDDAKTRSFVDYVGRMLVMYRGIYLKKFAVSFCYDRRFASNVDTWVQFAIKNKVKDITLRCLLGRLYFYGRNFFHYLYELPQMLYSNSSLTGLTIYFCDVAPRGVVAWGSLKSLSIGVVTLQDNIMENILSGCPVLEVLCLTDFQGLNCLNICSRNLKKLVIENWNGDLLEISAPYVLDLSISIEADVAGKFSFKNISSVVRAKLYFEMSGLFKEHPDPLSLMNYMKELLESIKSVQKLELGPWCIEVLSMMEAKGWKLPQSTRSCLTLNPWRVKEAVPGILGILKSSPNLTTLVIEGRRSVQIYAPLDRAAKYLHNNDLDLDAFHLKSVKINNFIQYTLPDEPMLTMARILLKRSRVLEKMVITAKELIKFSSYKGSRNLAEIAIKLLTFPRASPEAVVMVDN